MILVQKTILLGNASDFQPLEGHIAEDIAVILLAVTVHLSTSILKKRQFRGQR